jgi:hypothetical protein
MELDLETFLVALYVIVDDFDQSDIKPCMPACGGPPAQRSDSEVLCRGLAAQWRSGVPGKSERGILRYVRKHLRHFFPTVLPQRAFNRRLRRLWGRTSDPFGPTTMAGGPDQDGFPCRWPVPSRSATGWWPTCRIAKGGRPLCLRRAQRGG